MSYPNPQNSGLPPSYAEHAQPYPPPQYPASAPQPFPGYPQPQQYGSPDPGFIQPPVMSQPGGQYPMPMQQPVPGYVQPVIAQPHSAGQMQMQQPVPLNCPPGLEYLAMVDQILVHQKVELLEAFTGFETQNKYTIKNSMGQKIFTAKESSDCCSRMFCGPLRSFDMKIKDNSENEVIHLVRPLACNSCCFPCCLQEMEVFSPPGHLIGSVHQNWSLCKPKFSVKDASGETVLQIEGPFCTFSMCGDVKFRVLSLEGQKIGKISKQWSGLTREAFTDADMFGINFPMDLDAKMKAVLIGACLLIDFMFFEKSNNKEQDGVGML